LSWEPEDVYVRVPEGLTGEIPVYVDILGMKSNKKKLLILETDPLLRIMCFGDSIVYGGAPELLQVVVDTHPYLQGLEPVVMNHGKAMELVSREATWTRWSNALHYHEPDLAILLEATNDVSDNEAVSAGPIRDSVTRMVDEAMLKGVDVMLSTLLPRVGPCGDVESPTTEEHNAWLASFASERGIPLVDLFGAFVSTPGWEDEFFKAHDCAHPNRKGKEKIAEVFSEAIEEMYLASCTDLDGDGYGNPNAPSCDYFGRDCDDGNPNVYPAEIEEACDNGLDDDCDGFADGLDRDCMTGSCAHQAEASVHVTNRVYGAEDLLRHSAFFMLPAGLALVWRRLRRK
jgi:lysophospholipase L1-like esterase